MALSSLHLQTTYDNYNSKYFFKVESLTLSIKAIFNYVKELYKSRSFVHQNLGKGSYGEWKPSACERASRPTMASASEDTAPFITVLFISLPQSSVVR